MCRVHILFFFFFETLKCARINDTSRVIRNPNILHMQKTKAYFLYFLNQKFQPLAIFCGSTARFVSDLVGYHRIQVLAEFFFPHDMVFCTVTTFCLIRNKHIQQKFFSSKSIHEPHREKTLYSGFPTRFNTNCAVQPQKMPKGLNFGFRN